MSVAHNLQPAVNEPDPKCSHKAIWLTLAAAFLLHAFFILAPLLKPTKQEPSPSSSIEVRLQQQEPPAALVESVEQQPEQQAMPPNKLQQQAAKSTTAEVLKPPLSIFENSSDPAAAAVLRQSEPHPEQTVPLNQQQLRQLGPQILSSQFMREKPIVENIFGAPLFDDPQPVRKEFHYPLKPNMITMLDSPLPDLPFAYTPGLVRFSYEPGTKGEMQRLWDTLTPEFSWRSRYGTKFQCKWILVVPACAWGRSND